MRSAAAMALRQFVVPNGVLFAVCVLWLYLAPPAPSLVAASPVFAALIFLVGAVLAWRFHTWRALLAILLLALAERAVAWGGAGPAGGALVNAVGLLLPINIALLMIVDDASFDGEAFGWWAGLVLTQAVAVAVLCRPELASMLDWVVRPLVRVALPGTVAQLPLLALLLAALAQVLRFALTRKPLDIALFWALGAGLFGLQSGRDGLSSAYFAVSGIMLGAAVVETSYLIAFYDELTNLPGRRAFRQIIAKLRGDYAIAVVDVDHFKKFNDTFGHDVGDQVLRMVAGKLAQVTGGGAAFRCGGEEFSVVFRGLTAEEALAHAELLRESIAASRFIVRGPDRSSRHREERRYGKVNRRAQGRAVTTSVTVSIGLASPFDGTVAVEDVIRAADKALYRAKSDGRNRVAVHRKPQASRTRVVKHGAPVIG